MYINAGREENPRQRAVSGQFGAFFLSLRLRAAACAVHNLYVQAPLTLRGIL